MKEITDWEEVPKDQITDWEEVPIGDAQSTTEQNEPGFINSLKRGGNRVAQSISAFDLATSLAYEQANKGLYKKTNNPRYLKDAEQNKTDAGQFFSDVVNTQKDIESYPQHPDTQAAMKAAGEAGELVKKYGDPDKFLGNGALGQSLAAISELSNKFGESDNKMGIAADLVGEQIPNMAATILGSKGIGSLLGVAAPKLAGTLLGEAAVVGGGSAIGSFASTYGTNVSDGIQKGMTPEAAANYGAKKSAIQSLVDGAAGAFVPIKFGGQVVNIPTQTAIQMIGGGGGEYLASIGVGEVPNLSDVVLEGVLEVIGLPGDMVSASLAKDGKVTTKPVNKNVIPDDPNAPTTTGTLEEMLTGTAAQSIAAKQAQPATTLATTNATTPTQEVLAPAIQPPPPSLQSDIESGLVNSDSLKQMKQSGEIDFINGKWDYVNNSMDGQSTPSDAQAVADAVNQRKNIDPSVIREYIAQDKVRWNNGKLEVVEQVTPQAMPNDAQSVVDAVNSGGDIDRNTLVRMLKSGAVKWNNGKLEATPVSPEQQAAMQQLSQDVSKNLAQQQAVPLLEYSSTGVENVDSARDLRKQSLANVIGQMIDSRDAHFNKNIDDTNIVPNRDVAYTKAVQDYHLRDKAVNDLKGQLLPNELPIASAYSDTDTVKATFDNIINRDIDLLDIDVLHDLIDNGLAALNREGRPTMTDTGNRLYQELTNIGQTNDNQVTPETAPINDQNRDSVVSDEGAEVVGENPQSAVRAAKEQFDIKKNLVSSYLQNEQIGALAKDGIITDNDLDVMANLEMQSGGKAREQYVSALIGGKNPSKVLQKTGYQEPLAQPLPTPNTTKSTEPVWVEPTAPVKDTRNAFERTLSNRKADLGKNLADGYTVDGIVKEAKRRLGEFAKKTGRVIDNNNVLPDLRLVGLQDRFSNPSEGMKQLAKFIEDESAIKSVANVRDDLVVEPEAKVSKPVVQEKPAPKPEPKATPKAEVKIEESTEPYKPKRANWEPWDGSWEAQRGNKTYQQDATKDYVHKIKSFVEEAFGRRYVRNNDGTRTLKKEVETPGVVSDIGDISGIGVDLNTNNGELNFRFTKDGDTVGGAIISNGKIKHIALDEKERGNRFGENFLKYLRDNNLADINNVQDRSSAFVSVQNKVLKETQTETESNTQFSVTQKKPILSRLFGRNKPDIKAVEVENNGENYTKSGNILSTAFKNWFGDSKVVDKSGQPLRVYHGSNYKFDTFKDNGGLRSYFFSNNPSVASTYARNTNPNVMPVYLSLKNPKIIDAQGRTFYNIDGNKLTSQHAALEAQNEGYDGLIVKNVIDDFTNSTNTTSRTSDVYIAFEPTQIKSASGNNGNYDSTDPSIVNSVTPSPAFIAQKDQLKAKVTAIIRKINPTVNISLVDNLMGEGQALKDSGASSTDAQEVAGAYSRLKNLIYASMNTDKWNPEDTAYHEAFHSIFDMLSPTDKAILEKAFPGKGDITSEEQMAIEFARFMTEKNATGFRPAVRRIFLAIKEALRQIGRTLKLGKFESFEDVFNKVESGEVYKGRDAAREAVASANVAKLDQMLTDGEITQEQLKKAVMDLSPELYDVVYDDTVVSEEDEVAMADMVAESTGLPEDVLYSVTKRVFSKVPPDREKMLKGFVNFVSPVMGKERTERDLADIDNTIKNTKKPADAKPDKLNKFELVLRELAQTADGSGRYIANAYNSKAMHKVLDFFYHDAGKDKSVEGTYHENVAEYIGINTNKIAKVLYSLNDKQLDQVTDMLQNPNKVFEATDRVRNAAKVIAQIIKEQRAYLEAAGMPVVHELEGYFPRIYDADKIMQNLEEFSKAARQAYSLTFADDLHKQHGKLKEEVDRLTKKQQSYEKNLLNDPNYGNRKTDAGTKYSTLFESRAKKLENIKRNYSPSPDAYVGNVLTEKVDRWIESIAKAAQFGHSHDDDFNVLSDLPPQPDETKHRVLTKEADEIMRQFVMRNPVDVMTASLGRAARAAEFNRRLGKEQWVALKKQMQDEGVDKEGLIQIKKVIYANTGMLNHIDGKARDALGAVRYWSNLMFLSKSALSSLSEGFTVATKTGSPRDGLRTMYDGFRAAFKTKGTQEMRDISDMYGITGEIADDMMMMQRSGGEYDSRARAFANARLFKRYALTGLTSGQMSATFKTGQFFIGKLAEHIANNHDKKRSSEFLMSEYGVPKDKIEEFSKWVTTNGGGKLSTEFGLGNSEMAKYYRTALQRFVKTTVQVPTPATRQRYASTPVGQFVYGLSSYINAYSKNVLIRNYRIGKEFFNQDKGYTAADRVVMARQVMMVPVLGLMAAAVGELRDELFPNPDAKEKTLVDRGLTAVSRASFVGSFDPLLNMFGSFRYQRDPLNTFNGPVPSMVAGMIKAFGNLFMNNSENTNTAERNFAKLAYSTTIAPILTSAIATYSPWGKVGFAAIQAVNAPVVKSAVADITAGKAKQK